MPVWGTMVRVPDLHGRLKPEDATAIAARGLRAAERVSKVIRKFETRCCDLWPLSPQTLLGDPPLLDRLRSEALPGLATFRNFWDAIVFDRDCYTCRYCGRDAFQFFRETGKWRTLWLVVDHLDATGKVQTCGRAARAPAREKPSCEVTDSAVR